MRLLLIRTGPLDCSGEDNMMFFKRGNCSVPEMVVCQFCNKYIDHQRFLHSRIPDPIAFVQQYHPEPTTRIFFLNRQPLQGFVHPTLNHDVKVSKCYFLWTLRDTRNVMLFTVSSDNLFHRNRMHECSKEAHDASIEKVTAVSKIKN